MQVQIDGRTGLIRARTSSAPSSWNWKPQACPETPRGIIRILHTCWRSCPNPGKHAPTWLRRNGQTPRAPADRARSSSLAATLRQRCQSGARCAPASIGTVNHAGRPRHQGQRSRYAVASQTVDRLTCLVFSEKDTPGQRCGQICAAEWRWSGG